MKFIETKIRGCFIIEIEKLEDPRGFFGRSWCRKEFEERGLDPELAQCNVSLNKKKGTLRGLHYQAKPHEEAKLVFCPRGAIYDVVVDLRQGSPTFCAWAGAEINQTNLKMVYVPAGCGHGFQTLEEDTLVIYQMSEFYDASLARGVRFDDKRFGIKWPLPISVISDRDRSFPNFIP